MIAGSFLPQRIKTSSQGRLRNLKQVPYAGEQFHTGFQFKVKSEERCSYDLKKLKTKTKTNKQKQTNKQTHKQKNKPPKQIKTNQLNNPPNHTHTRTCKHTHTHTHTHIHLHTHTHTRTCRYIRVRERASTGARTHTRIRTHTRTHARTQASTHARTYTHARTHSHTHTHIHTHIQSLQMENSTLTVKKHKINPQMCRTFLKFGFMHHSV